MTYSVDVYDNKGKVVSKVELNNDVFNDGIVNKGLIHEYYLLQQANDRISIAHTKNRGEVAGSGKKLYRQKGTGNARVGDKKSPIRKGGGVSFGPRNEKNYTKSMNKKARKRAINGLLVLKVKDGNLLGLNEFKEKEPKTKKANEILNNIGLSDKKILFVIEKKDNIVEKSFRNIDKVKYITVDYLNPVDLLKYQKILFMEDALRKINNHL